LLCRLWDMDWVFNACKEGWRYDVGYLLDVCSDGLAWYGTCIEAKALSEKDLDDFSFTWDLGGGIRAKQERSRSDHDLADHKRFDNSRQIYLEIKSRTFYQTSSSASSLPSPSFSPSPTPSSRPPPFPTPPEAPPSLPNFPFNLFGTLALTPACLFFHIPPYLYPSLPSFKSPSITPPLTRRQQEPGQTKCQAPGFRAGGASVASWDVDVVDALVLATLASSI
jgi:hypothetical protein